MQAQEITGMEAEVFQEVAVVEVITGISAHNLQYSGIISSRTVLVAKPRN